MLREPTSRSPRRRGGGCSTRSGTTRAGPGSRSTPSATEPAWDRDGMHSGIGGLAPGWPRSPRPRPWTAEESALAAAIGERLRAVTPTATDVTCFDGLVSHLECLVLLGEPGAEACVDRLLELDRTAGRTSTTPRSAQRRSSVGGLTAVEAGCARGAELAAYAADRLLAEAEETAAGLNWLFVPRRLRAAGQAGWTAGRSRCRTGRTGWPGSPACWPRPGSRSTGPTWSTPLGEAPSTWSPWPIRSRWPTVASPYRARSRPSRAWTSTPGTGATARPAPSRCSRRSTRPASPRWRGSRRRPGSTRCLHSLHTSGIPERRWPGFWDNDGRCCGTAGVGRPCCPTTASFALALADDLVDRAYVEGDRAYWRFTEHRNDEPLLPPGVGWMQGAAGIAGFLFEVTQLAH